MKRYKLGQRRTKTDAHGNSATMPDMIECENGDYIKYSEYEHLLESIGAGGVSQREQKAFFVDVDIDDVIEYLKSWGCLEHDGVRALVDLHCRTHDKSQPDQALLISMATRLRHDFGLLDKGAQALMLSEMRKLWEEVVGLGYYQPGNSGRYLDMLATNDHIPDAGKMMHQVDKLDEREAFERKFPTPNHCQWNGAGYSVTEYHAWDADRHKRRFEGWIARAALAKQNTDKVDAARKEPTK